MSKVTELHKTTFADILNMFGQEKSESNHTPKFLTDSAGQRGLPMMVICIKKCILSDIVFQSSNGEFEIKFTSTELPKIILINIKKIDYKIQFIGTL